MTSVTALGILCLVGPPALAPWSLTVDVTSGTMLMDLGPNGVGNPDPVGPVGVAGTFTMTIYDEGNGCVGNSDTVVLDGCDLANTEALQTVLIGVATATVPAGYARFTDFATATPGHIDNGSGVVVANSYLEFTMLVTGEMYTTYSTSDWCDRHPSLPFNLTFDPPTSASASDVLAVTLSGRHIYEIGTEEMSATLTVELIVDVTGTVHVPEPALCSLIVMGLGGAGVWLRRRRR